MNLFSSKTVLVALGAAVLFLATPASAQTSNVRVDVPFSFVAGGQLLQAGEYRIDVDDARHIVRIASVDTGSMNFVRVLPVTTSRGMRDSDKAVVRFARQGEQYVLDGVWQRGEVQGNIVMRSHHSSDGAKTAPVRDIVVGNN